MRRIGDLASMRGRLGFETKLILSASFLDTAPRLIHALVSFETKVTLSPSFLDAAPTLWCLAFGACGSVLRGLLMLSK
jgi:hypothetical protein